MKYYRLLPLFYLLSLLILIPPVILAGTSEDFLTKHRNDHYRRITRPTITAIEELRTAFPVQKTQAGEDILVSESVAPARFNQDNAAVARLTDGRMVIVWDDDRNGNKMIFAQILNSSGNPAGDNFIIAGTGQYTDRVEPKVVSDGSGGFYVAWREVMTGRLMGVHYNSSGGIAAGPFQINDTDGGAYAGPFDIAAYSSGSLVAVWEDYSDANNIKFRVISTTGSPLTDPVTVNSVSSFDFWYPAVAINSATAAIAVAWEDFRNGTDPDIYMQYVNTDGSLAGNNFSPVSASATSANQYFPDIAFNTTDKFIIAWNDDRGGNNRIYFQRHDRISGLLGSNTAVSTDSSEVESLEPSVTAMTTGFAISWEAYSTNVPLNIVMQRFSNGGTANGSRIRVSDDPSNMNDNPAIGYDNAGKIHALWTGYSEGQQDIKLQQFGTDGSALGISSLKINDDTAGAPSIEAKLAVANDTLAVVIYRDEREDAGDIYMRLLGQYGELYGGNWDLSGPNPISTKQYDPYVTCGENSYDAVWIDDVAMLGTVGPRIFWTANPFVTDIDNLPIHVTPSLNVDPKKSPRIAAFGNGYRFLAWLNFVAGDWKIHAYRFTAETVDWDNPDIITVSNAGVETDNDFLCIGHDGNDIVTLVYLSRGYSGGPNVRVARFDNTGSEIGRFGFAGDVGGVAIEEISAAVGTDGVIYLLWRGDDDNLYLTSLGINGAVLTPSFVVNDDSGAMPEELTLAVGRNGAVIAGWIDHREGRPKMYYQTFEPNLAPMSVNLPASGANVNFMMNPTVAGDNSKIWLAWSDPRENGLNVYARQADYVPTDVGDDEPGHLPSGFALMQNYPNPFNPSTTIEFTLPARSEIEVNIYDILGRKVITLAEGVFGAGRHSLVWDTSVNGKAASGVYFYLLKTSEGSQARKMILLK